MDIGKLDKRIQLQSKSATLDEYGQQINSWSTVATVWANVKPISGREKLRSMAMQLELTHTVAVRYNVNFLPPKAVSAWRINYNANGSVRLFNITSVMDLNEDRKFIIFECIEDTEIE